jgi:y4mF family transcriptional regulator
LSGVLAAELRARRVQLRLRQEEVADLAGVSERFVYALENGKKTVQLDKVLAVLNALGLHLELHRGASAEIRSATDKDSAP